MLEQASKDFEKLDGIKASWARSQGIVPVRMSHQEQNFWRVAVTTSGGDVYEIALHAAAPGTNQSNEAIAAASLSWKAGSRHHALRSLRQQFTFEVPTTVAGATQVLDLVLEQVRKWARESGHTVSI